MALSASNCRLIRMVFADRTGNAKVEILTGLCRTTANFRVLNPGTRVCLLGPENPNNHSLLTVEHALDSRRSVPIVARMTTFCGIIGLSCPQIPQADYGAWDWPALQEDMEFIGFPEIFPNSAPIGAVAGHSADAGLSQLNTALSPRCLRRSQRRRGAWARPTRPPHHERCLCGPARAAPRRRGLGRPHRGDPPRGAGSLLLTQPGRHPPVRRVAPNRSRAGRASAVDCQGGPHGALPGRVAALPHQGHRAGRWPFASPTRCLPSPANANATANAADLLPQLRHRRQLLGAPGGHAIPPHLRGQPGPQEAAGARAGSDAQPAHQPVSSRRRGRVSQGHQDHLRGLSRGHAETSAGLPARDRWRDGRGGRRGPAQEGPGPPARGARGAHEQPVARLPDP
eukprot:scaffold1307_cov200-Pinguiococcus_pyrenoidosus.AAC.127